MYRRTSQFIVVLLLAVSSFALLRVSATMGSGTYRGESPSATQTVRNYYVSLNRFLAGGDIDEMSQYLATLAPWHAVSDDSGEWTFDTEMELLAFRSTFPDLQIDPVEITTARDLVIVRAAATTGEASSPSWVNGGAGQTYPSTVESFRVVNGQIVEHWSSARLPEMSLSLAMPDVRFRLDWPARLTISELMITASEPATNFVSAPGPGFAIPQAGAFTVEGNGQLRIASWIDGANLLVPLHEKAVVSAGQVLVISKGQAVIRQAGDQPSKFLLMSMVPGSSEPWEWEMDGGSEPVESLEDVLARQSTSPTNLWFGTARVLASSPAETAPGWLSMDLIQAIVPPGERLDIDSLHFQVAVLESSSGAGQSERNALGGFSITNDTNLTRVFAIVRACSHGSEYPGPTMREASCPTAGSTK